MRFTLITIKPVTDVLIVLSFYGTVLELFIGMESSRIHVSLLTNIVFKTDKHGAHTLDIDTGIKSANGYKVDELAFPKVSQLIADLLKAKSAFIYD